MKRTLLIAFALALLGMQESSVRCGREDDGARPEDRVACECYKEKDPCEAGETRACAAWCKKENCGCCQP